MGRSQSEDPKLAEVKAVLARLQSIDIDFDATATTWTEKAPAASARSSDDQTVTPARPAQAATPFASVPASRQSSQKLPGRSKLIGVGASAVLVVVGLAATRAFWDGETVSVSPVAASGTTSDFKSAAQSTPEAPEQRVAAKTTTPSSPSPSLTLGPLPSRAAAPMPKVAAEVSVPSGRPSIDDGPSLSSAEGLIGAGRLIAGRAELMRIGPQSADVALALARSYDPNFVNQVPNADARADIEQATEWYRAWHELAIRQGSMSDGISIERIIRSMR